jgi:hypothetical protein
MTVWSYKISRDFGFAPNPFFGYCTVACCKPNIRERAQIGDLIFGCSAKELGIGERLIFAMRVAEKLNFNEYWADIRFISKKPLFSSGMAHAYGDNIYHSDEEGNWFQKDSHHSLQGGAWNDANATRDLTSEFVLISDDFVYFGRQAIEMPPHLRNFEGDDLYPQVRNFRNGYSPAMQEAARDWFDHLPNGRFGRPINWR